MLDSARPVHKVVDLPLKHRLKVLLHLSSCDLDNDAHVHRALRGNLREIWPDDIDLAVSNFVKFRHVQEFKGARALATEFHAQVCFADNFAFESRTIR